MPLEKTKGSFAPKKKLRAHLSYEVAMGHSLYQPDVFLLPRKPRAPHSTGSRGTSVARKYVREHIYALSVVHYPPPSVSTPRFVFPLLLNVVFSLHCIPIWLTCIPSRFQKKMYSFLRSPQNLTLLRHCPVLFLYCCCVLAAGEIADRW